PVELPEDPLLLAVRDAETLVPDRDAEARSVRLAAGLDAPPPRGVLARVVPEVDQPLPQLVLVAGDERSRLCRGELQRDIFALGEAGAHLLDDVLREAGDVEPVGLQVQAGGVG